MNILVIDVGTSSIRGVLYDPKGQELFVHQIGYQVHFFGEIYAEQPASDWAEAIVEISRETVTEPEPATAKAMATRAATVPAVSRVTEPAKTETRATSLMAETAPVPIRHRA